MRRVLFLLAAWCLLLPGIAAAQGLTGSLIGTVGLPIAAFGNPKPG